VRTFSTVISRAFVSTRALEACGYRFKKILRIEIPEAPLMDKETDCVYSTF
jgi:hypothetical protein